MNELALKYGCNPNQKPSRIYMEDGSDLPVTVLNGKPGYINFLDALNSIQLVKELKAACGLPAAASFKHVSPVGAALGLPLTDVERKMYHIAPEMELSPLANAYARARGAERRRTSWHNQQNCIKTQGGRHKKRTALLVYPFKSRSAASVSASAAPDASSPLFCWNWRSACSVSAPKSPSAPCRGRGKPAAISALCSPFTASPESPICISPIRPANIVSIP